MIPKRRAKQARGQRGLLNLVLLRVCSDSCGSGGAGSRTPAYLYPRFPPLAPSTIHTFTSSLPSLCLLCFPCMLPHTDEIMALISFQLLKGASGRHSRTKPQIFFKAAAELQVDTPARTPTIIENHLQSKETK